MVVIIIGLIRNIKKKNKRIKSLEHFRDIFIKKYDNECPTITGGKL